MPNLLDKYPLSERYQERAEGNMPYGSTAGGEVTNPRLAATETQHVKADSGVLGHVNIQGQFELNPLGSMAAGQTAYNTGIGWFFDIDPTAGPRFSIGDSGAGQPKLLWDGDELVIVGSITADDGEIGGWEIGASQLEGGDVVLDSSGIIIVGDGDNVAVLSSVDPTYRLWVGDAAGVDAPFSVTQEGSLYSALGEIGGWEIGATSLEAGSIMLDSANGRIEFGTGDYIGDNVVHFEVGTTDTVTMEYRNPSFTHTLDVVASVDGLPGLAYRIEAEYGGSGIPLGLLINAGNDDKFASLYAGAAEFGVASNGLFIDGISLDESAGSVVGYLEVNISGTLRKLAVLADS